MSQRPSPRQFIISGFHRSGTSLTAQYLHRAGLNLGDNLLGANPSNPDGHFEDREIVALHQAMLAANQRDWYTPGPDLSAMVDGFQARAKALLSQFPTDEPIGFKDPRSSLFLPWWQRQLDQPAAVIVYRHYAGCFHSLRNRQAQNLVFAPSQHQDALFFWQQPALALELWLSYNNAILDYVRAHRKTTLLVSHYAMLAGFNLPAAVNQRLGLSLDTRCESGIRPGNSHRSEIPECIDATLRARLDATLAALNALCCSDAEPAGSGSGSDINLPALMHRQASIQSRTETIEHWFDRLHIPASTDKSVSQPATSAHQLESEPENAAGFAEDSEDVKQLIHWGKQHQARQNDNAAEACWLKAHSLAPGNVAPLLHLALLARNHGDNEKTVRLMQSAIQRKPDNAGFHFHLARALNYCDKTEQALHTVRHGLILQHDHRDLQLLQLELLLALDKPVEARTACKQALLLFPDDTRFMKIMVRMMGDAGDSSAAMSWFRRSVLSRIREKDDYRQTLMDAMNQLPVSQQAALSKRVIEELKKLDSDAKPGAKPDAIRSQTGHNFRLAMSILVRDEADIIEDNILYHAAAGVDHFIVTDNGSVDGTRELLEGLRQEVDLVIIDEPSHTIDQDIWVTRMAKVVRESHGADWVINNDADEFWLSHAGFLKEAIVRDLDGASTSGLTIGTLHCQRFNLIPSLESVSQTGYRYYDNHYKVIATLHDREQCNSWHENNSNSLIRTLPGKVISRLDGLDRIDMGNHGAQHRHARHECNSVSIAHYPVRSYEQFEKKVVNYGQSLANNSRFAPNISRHLRFWYEQYQQDNLYQEYLKFVLPECRLEELIGDGVLCVELGVASDISGKIHAGHVQPMSNMG